MSNRLSKKEKVFVKEFIKSDNATQSALTAYDTKSENTAAAIGSENLRKPKIIQAIQEMLPDELLAAVHLEGLKAGRKVGDGIEPDYMTRAKYLDLGYKIKGSYAAEKHINLNVESKPSERLQSLADRLLVVQSSYEERSEDDSRAENEN